MRHSRDQSYPTLCDNTFGRGRIDQTFKKHTDTSCSIIHLTDRSGRSLNIQLWLSTTADHQSHCRLVPDSKVWRRSDENLSDLRVTTSQLTDWRTQTLGQQHSPSEVSDVPLFVTVVICYRSLTLPYLHGLTLPYLHGHWDWCLQLSRHLSASVVRQSAEVDRSTLSSEQFRSSVFCCRGPVDLEFATWQSSWPSTESQHV